MDMDISEPYVPPRDIPKSDGAQANLQSSTFSHNLVKKKWGTHLVLARNDVDSQLLKPVEKHGFDVLAMRDKVPALNELGGGEDWSLFFLDVDDVTQFFQEKRVKPIETRFFGIVSDVRAMDIEKYREADPDGGRIPGLNVSGCCARAGVERTTCSRAYQCSALSLAPEVSPVSSPPLSTAPEASPPAVEVPAPAPSKSKKKKSKKKIKTPAPAPALIDECRVAGVKHTLTKPSSEGDIKKVLLWKGELNMGNPEPCEPCRDQNWLLSHIFGQIYVACSVTRWSRVTLFEQMKWSMSCSW
ncbi:hypothetical protein Dimus_014327 [Dionaea muscipula]